MRQIRQPLGSRWTGRRVPLGCHTGGMARRQTTLYLDDEILQAAQVVASRSHRDQSQVVEDALRSYLGLDVVEEVWRSSDLSEAEALALADEEKHAAREQ